MCYRPVNIVNQSRHLTDGSPFRLSVPCGKCASCQVNKQNEYHLRNYYECMATFNAGGFVYMDCLTYSDESLPHLKDFLNYIPDSLNYPCFSYPDFRLFMVRLRRHLTNLGFDVKSSLRYFMASEYGTSERCTHRPHYHVLFYVTSSFDSLVLSKAVADCWPFGRTDGLPYKSPSYVLKNTFRLSDGISNCERCINYVTKYVGKQQFYETIVNDRVDSIIHYFGYDPFSKESKLLYKDVRKYSCQFHRQSEGFGLSALEDSRNSLDNIVRSGCLSMTSRNGVIKSIPLPQYFSRKLFYDVTRALDGSLHWYLNNDGIDYRLKRLDVSLDYLSLRFADIYANLHILRPSSFNYDKQIIDSLLDGRSWRDFAIYLLCYRGRIIPSSKDMDYISFYKSCFLPYWDNVIYNYSTSKNVKKYGDKFLSLVDVERTNTFLPSRIITNSRSSVSDVISLRHTLFPHYSVSRLLKKLPFCYSVDEFEKFCIWDTYDDSFNNFDHLYALMCDFIYPSSDLRQLAFNLKQKLSNLYKSWYI